MKLQDFIGSVFILIVIFLLLNRSADTAKVISSLSGAFVNDVSVLQGTSSGQQVASSGSLSPIQTILRGFGGGTFTG